MSNTQYHEFTDTTIAIYMSTNQSF